MALKVMSPGLAADLRARNRFLREARAAAAVHHDNVVTIYQVGQENDVPFLAMELLEGEALDTRLKRERRLPTSEILRIGRETASGLAAAHQLGVIHRDIKPANLWLEAANGRVKILDFGLARQRGEAKSATQFGAIVEYGPLTCRPSSAPARKSIRAAICSAWAACCIGYVPGKLPSRVIPPSLL